VRLVIVAGPPRPATAHLVSTGPSAVLREVADEVLARLAADPDVPPALPAGWERDPALDDLRERLRREVGDEATDGASPVIWEDPRAASILPLLDDVLTVVAAVIVVAEPDEVVRALVDAEALDVDVAADRWTRTLVNAVVDASAPVLATAGTDPEEVLARVVELTGDELDRDTLTAAIEHAAPDRPHDAMVGQTIGGERLELARTVHRLLVEHRAATGPLLAELRAGWAAIVDADRARREAARTADALATERGRRERVTARADESERELASMERRWAETAREATVREDELARQNQHLRAELGRLEGQLDEMRRHYDRLRKRRVVRTALAVAEVAKPLVGKVREYRSGDGETADGDGDDESAPSVRVHTVLLNYRYADDTLRCVRSLEASAFRSQHLVVVDNGSGEETVAELRRGLGARTLLETGENLGYAGGNNVGIRYALDRDTDFVWVLNPDTVVEPRTLSRLLRTMEEEPDCGVLGGRLLNGGTDPLTIASDGGIIDRERGGATDHRHVGDRDADVPAGGPHPVDYVPGAGMLIRRRTLEDVGLLPEEFFLYFEETEFNLRVRRAGWRVLVDPRARIHHHKRSSGRLPAPYYVYYFVRNRVLFAERHVPGWDGELPPDLETWIDAWREKVERADASWVSTYEELVERALTDARAGVDGRRDDIEAVEPGVDRG
jgi:GT2 family glycosyltransferase